MSTCLICGSPAEQFISFGQMPIANGFLLPEQLADEHFFELAVAFCASCTMVQLVHLVEPSKMFHENYAFFSSTSTRMAAHFADFAQDVRSKYLQNADPFVVEIGSNDGIMLQHFAKAGIRHLGIEPSANVAQVAIDKGIRTITRFFDEALAREIVSEHGKASAMLGANVMCHIPTLHSVAAGAAVLLEPGGVLVFEDPYLGEIVEKTSYDQIYDEHAFYFSVSSLTKLFASHGMEIVDVAAQDVHGGSMRYTVAHRGTRPVSPAVEAQRAHEARLGLHSFDTFVELARRIERSRAKLLDELQALRTQGKRVVGYGATSKSTTVTNYCRITPDLVEFISDTTPIKQGKLSPGAHIPVKPYSEFTARYPDVALLFAWNHAAEIMAKETRFREHGGKWLVYVPEVAILT
jgi:methylation protein EvaC